MTLSNCVSKCHIEYSLSNTEAGISSFIFEGEENEAFKSRLQKFLDSIHDLYPLAKKINFKVTSENTFPHSAGIASSASAMSAFCACLVEIEEQVEGNIENKDQRISTLSRLASGSACRSIYPNYAYWGESRISELNSSNEYARELLTVHPEFKNVCDSILIVSGDEKSVSSSQGHILMNGHPFKESRIEQANDNFRSILNAMESGDWESFGEILENEALTLHALMMSSYPSFILLEPNSLTIIEKIRVFRKETKLPLYFTIDAGPNLHLIYPEKIKEQVEQFIDKSLKSLCADGKVIHDLIGSGVIKL
jgi:diphosphomevalonate decarboxylase